MGIIRPIKLNSGKESLEEEVERFHEWQDHYQGEMDKLLYRQKCELIRKNEIIAKLTSESAAERERRLKDAFQCGCHNINTIQALHEELVAYEKAIDDIGTLVGACRGYY